MARRYRWSNLGLLLAGIWFILWGILQFVSIAGSGTILAILAIIAGILLIFYR